MFLRKIFILILFLASMLPAPAIAARCPPGQTTSLLKRIFAGKNSESETATFDSKKFEDELARFQKLAREGELKSISPALLKTGEEKLALLEALTQHEGSSLYNFDRLVAEADDDQLERIMRVMKGFKATKKGAVPTLPTRQLTEDLYLLSHPVSRSKMDWIFGRANKAEASRLIQDRMRFAFAHEKLDKALADLGWADSRKLTRLKVWLKDHPNLNSGIMLTAREGLSYASSEVFGRFAGIPELPIPWKILNGTPHLTLFNANLGDRELMNAFGSEMVMPHLLKKYQTRAQAELAYAYYVRPALIVGGVGYAVVDNWGLIKSGVESLPFVFSVLRVSDETMAREQAKHSLSETQVEQIKSSLTSQWLDSPEAIAPQDLWQIVRENTSLKRSDVYKNYTHEKHKLKAKEEVLPPTTDRIEKTGLAVLATLRQDSLVKGAHIDETETNFKKWIGLQFEVQKTLPSENNLPLDAAENIVRSVLQKNHLAADPASVKSLLLESAAGKADQSVYIGLKREYALRNSRSPN